MGHSHPIVPRQGDAMTTAITPLPKRLHHRVMGIWLVAGTAVMPPRSRRTGPGQHPPSSRSASSVRCPAGAASWSSQRQMPWRKGVLSSWTPAAALGKREADRWAATNRAIINPTATLLEHALLAQGFTGVSKVACPHRLQLQNRDFTGANLSNAIKCRCRVNVTCVRN
jgi:hypothetical protein